MVKLFTTFIHLLIISISIMILPYDGLQEMMNAEFDSSMGYSKYDKTEENIGCGNKFIDSVAIELKLTFPNLKGFSARNLKYMKSFYNEYKDDNDFVQLVAQLPRKHNLTLMQKVKDKEIRKWYMNKCLKEGWSDSILTYQIDANLYNRQEKV